jgi:ABC-2 type transport system ATP-binding protein
MDLVKITDHSGRLIKNLSKGYRQRVGLAESLVGNPPVLILDEPTVGLDPKQIIEIRTLIKKLGKEHTLILSSHVLPEVMAVCERVIIIHKGNIVASDTLENLSKSMTGSHRLNVRVSGAEKDALTALQKIPETKKAEVLGSREPGTVDIYVEAKGDKDIREPVFHALSRADCPILQMRSVDLTLEDIFVQLTTDEASERSEVS